ncbi:LacI family DNA-binding transcriptional regulator [Kineococcus rubinsiae]|uniref:LacI family DNA-binding transcriptional regulator n=1 Tax=Kineococcus rubinsiae TaxID=2609562 RepID=UPI0014309A7D|nr:LacI family DNA-binding transcriptional regulator [Kineococcus rubinsiae]
MKHDAQARSHRPTPGTATLADVARVAGVSASTVSKVVRGLPGTSPGLRRRVVEAVEELDYRPHPAGRALSTGSAVLADPVTIAVPTLMSSYYRRLAGHLVRGAASAGLRSRIVQTDGSREVEADLLAASVQHGSPLLLAPWHVDPHRSSSGGATSAVLLADLDAWEDLDRVGTDSAGAADLCATHLLHQGRRRLAFVGAGGGGVPAAAALREPGFHAAHRRHGLEVPAGRTRSLPEWTAQHGAAATTALLREDPGIDGVVAANDQIAVGVLHALRSSGRRVPDDVAVTGVDDDDVARNSTPALTSVALPVPEMADAAFELLTERLAGSGGPARVRQFPGRLVVRLSSADRHRPGAEPRRPPDRPARPR